jgi:hypothetical protein
MAGGGSVYAFPYLLFILVPIIYIDFFTFLYIGIYFMVSGL